MKVPNKPIMHGSNFLNRIFQIRTKMLHHYLDERDEEVSHNDKGANMRSEWDIGLGRNWPRSDASTILQEDRLTPG